MIRRTILTFALVFLSAVEASAQSGGNADDPRLSYFVCDWGLLTVEQPTMKPAIFLTIDSPANYSGVASARFTVSGTGAGLFEGNVVVEAMANGKTVFTGTTTLQAKNPEEVGAWSLDVDLGDLPSPTPVFITAYAQSPADNTTAAADSIDVNINSTMSLPFVEITRPAYYAAGVSAAPLLIEGMAGAIFENNLVIEVQDVLTGNVLAETFATVQTKELGGSGPFSAEVKVDVKPGTTLSIIASQPPVSAEDKIVISDSERVVVDPLAQTYERFLNIGMNDPINATENVCTASAAEFDNKAITPLVVNDVKVFSTQSLMPLVNVSIEAAGSSNCPAPLRTRVTRTGNAFAIETYYDASRPVACTADLALLPQRVSLGTLPNPDFTITVNGDPAK